jgi:hypothetical protein
VVRGVVRSVISINHHGAKTRGVTESLDHAYVVAPNKIDEDRKANLTKSIFKAWPPVRFRRRPPFGATVLSQRTPIRAG